MRSDGNGKRSGDHRNDMLYMNKIILSEVRFFFHEWSKMSMPVNRYGIWEQYL